MGLCYYPVPKSAPWFVNAARDILVELVNVTKAYRSGEVTVDVELTAQGLMGQVLPPQSARIEVLSGPQAGAPLTTDDMGRFTCEVFPAGPFALRLRTGGEVIVTDWLTV